MSTQPPPPPPDQPASPGPFPAQDSASGQPTRLAPRGEQYPRPTLPAASSPPGGEPPRVGFGVPLRQGQTQLIVAIVAVVGILAIGGAIVALVDGKDTSGSRGGGVTVPTVPIPSPQPPGPQPPAPQPPQPQPPQPQPPVDPPQPPSGREKLVPPGGSLKDLVQERVGRFSFERAAGFPEMINSGASEAYRIIYSKQNGVRLGHDIAAFSSRADAEEIRRGTIQGLLSNGFEIVGQDEVTRDHDQVGTWVVLQGTGDQQELEIVVWNDLEVWCTAVSEERAAVEFYNKVPY